MKNITISVNEPMLLNALPGEHLLERLKKLIETRPGLYFVMNERNRCLDVYKITEHGNHRVPSQAEYYTQVLWE